VTEPCASCGGTQLAAVLIPGHDEVEAVVCLVCGAVQPALDPGLQGGGGRATEPRSGPYPPWA
jgi:hypothetical protein